MEMSSKPPIGCFNGSECIYDPKICRLYEDRTEECRLENLKNWLKEMTPPKYESGKPVGIMKPGDFVDIPADIPKRVDTPTTPPPPPRSAPKVGTITGKVLDDPVTREAKTQRGPKAVSSFRLDSGEEQVRVSLWERQDLAQLISAGNEITLEGVVEGTVYDGLKQFNGGNKTVLVGANVAGIAVPQQTQIPAIANPNAPASEKQINLLNKMGVKNISPNMTKQQASDLISSRMKK